MEEYTELEIEIIEFRGEEVITESGHTTLPEIGG